MLREFEGGLFVKEQTLLTSSQRKSIAENYRKIEQIREFIGTIVEVPPIKSRSRRVRGELVGWKFNEEGGVDYVLRLFETDECIFVSQDDFTW